MSKRPVEQITANIAIKLLQSLIREMEKVNITSEKRGKTQELEDVLMICNTKT